MIATACVPGASLVSRHRRIDFLGPGVDATGHVLDLRKSLLTEELCHPQAAAAVMAVNDDPLRVMRLYLAEPSGDFAHGDVRGAGDPGGGDFVRLAAIEQNEPLTAIEHLFYGADVDLKR